MDNELLKQLQQVELEIAVEIDRICRAHGLRYSLVGGSAIGAVRHKGFIPWDDDIDLAMPRGDYERFVELCRAELDSRYFLQCFDTEDNCAFIFAKVRKNGTRLPEKYSEHIKMHQGVWVDIFIYDRVSDDTAVRAAELRRLSLYRNLLIVKAGFKLPENRTSAVERAAYRLAKLPAALMGTQTLQRKCLEIMTAHRNEQTQYVFPYGGATGGEGELMPADFFDELLDAPFENTTLKLVAQYDHYLTSLFGDYMTPPPPEKRQAPNHFLDEAGIIL